jgi:SAM-dependent methyltransferase
VLAERLVPTELVGVDIDPELVAAARSRIRALGVTATIVEGDVRSLPFAAGAFDIVIDFGTCYHVSGGTGGAVSALSEIGRVLCAGGLFVHETPVAQHLAHPVRSFMRSLPWDAVTWCARDRVALLWAAKRKVS